VGAVEIDFVSVVEDPRDYKVSFERIAATLGYATTRGIAEGVEEIASAIEAGILERFDDPRYSNLRPPTSPVALAAV
jgi:hypothetical protein